VEARTHHRAPRQRTDKVTKIPKRKKEEEEKEEKEREKKYPNMYTEGDALIRMTTSA